MLLVHSIASLGYRLFANVAQRYRTPAEVTRHNLQHNTAVDHQNLQHGLVGRGVFINGQCRPAYNGYFLSGEGSYRNGCVPIGIYNSLVALGSYAPIPAIQQWLEHNRYVARPKKKKNPDGSVQLLWQGCVTIGVMPFFKARGYWVRTHYLPRQKRLEAAIQNSAVSILCIKNRQAGSHCIAATYDAAAQQFVLYNRYEHAQAALRLDTLAELYGTSARFVLVVYPIRLPK